MSKFKSLAVLGLLLLGGVAAVQAASDVVFVSGQTTQSREKTVADEIRQLQALSGKSRAPHTAKRVAPGQPATEGPRPNNEALPVINAATPRGNPVRTYAPSCVADPLPTQFSGPLYPPASSFRVRLLTVPRDSQGNYGTEFVSVRVWRVPCSSSGQFYDAVTLLAIDRDPGNEGSTTRVPLFPALRVSQGNAIDKLVRVADEPNTVLSHIYLDEPLIFSGTYVLENFIVQDSTTARWDFNNAFTLTFLNFIDPEQDLSVPAYNPTQATYPTAYQNIPITGYLTGNWYDPQHSGEGMLVQVFNLPNDPNNLLFTFAWFTFDRNGLPFWLFGSKVFPAEFRGPLVVPTVFGTNGGFAGAFTNATFNTWGNVTFEFPRCYSMRFSYNGSANAVNGPVGTGTRTNWVREVDTNGLTCE